MTTLNDFTLVQSLVNYNTYITRHNSKKCYLFINSKGGWGLTAYKSRAASLPQLIEKVNQIAEDCLNNSNLSVDQAQVVHNALQNICNRFERKQTTWWSWFKNLFVWCRSKAVELQRNQFTCVMQKVDTLARKIAEKNSAIDSRAATPTVEIQVIPTLDSGALTTDLSRTDSYVPLEEINFQDVQEAPVSVLPQEFWQSLINDQTQSIDFGDRFIDDNEIAYLKQLHLQGVLPHCKAVLIRNGSGLTAKCFEYLSQIEGLSSIEIKGYLGLDDITYLESMTDLTHFSISGVLITPRFLTSLRAMIQLEFLDLRGSKFVSEMDDSHLIEAFVALSSLTTLKVDNCKIRNIFFEAILTLPKLNYLRVERSEFCLSKVQPLTKNSNVQIIEFEEISLNPDYLCDHLTRLECLEKLSFEKVKIKAQDLKILSKLKQLKQIKVDDVNVDGAFLEALVSYPSLQTLHIKNGQFAQDKSYKLFCRLTIKELIIENSSGVNDKWVETLKNIVTLERIHLLAAIKLNKNTLQSLESLPNLTEIALNDENTTNTRILALKKVSRLTRLILQGMDENKKTLLSDWKGKLRGVEIQLRTK